MKTLLVTIGSHGDIHPFIAIADALRRQGHEAVIATNPYFERQIEASGTPFAALCEHSDLRQTIVEHQVMDPNRGPMNVLKKLVLPMVQETVRRTQELIRSVGADVVVYHPIVLGAPWACERAGGVPTVSISPSPTIWASRGDPLVMLPFHSTSPGRIAAAFDRFVSGLFLRTVLDPPLNRMRRELGLPPERNILWRHAREATLNLGIWSPVLRPPLPDDPTRSAIVGFTWHDRDHTQEATDVELREFLDAGPAPAVFALGSTGVHASGAFYEHAVRACAALSIRALLVVGRDQPPPANLPSDGSIKAVAYAPYSAVFARASVIVHHGGAGTTAQGLAAGRPTLITPMAHDQYDNAARVKRLGAGETLPFAKVNTRRLTDLLRTILTDDRYRQAAASLAPRVRGQDGASEAARLIAGLRRA